MEDNSDLVGVQKIVMQVLNSIDAVAILLTLFFSFYNLYKFVA